MTFVFIILVCAMLGGVVGRSVFTLAGGAAIGFVLAIFWLVFHVVSVGYDCQAEYDKDGYYHSSQCS